MLSDTMCLNPTAPSSVGKLDAEKHYLYLMSSFTPKRVVTAMHLTSSLFCAPHGSVTAHTWIDRGFGVACMPLAFTPLNQESVSTTGFGCFSARMQTHRRCTLWTTCLPPEPSQKKKDMLSELAFSGRHAKQSVWVLVQKYNTVCKDLREQTKWVALFHCKDRLSFTDALDENDVVPHELRNSLRSC